MRNTFTFRLFEQSSNSSINACPANQVYSRMDRSSKSILITGRECTSSTVERIAKQHKRLVAIMKAINPIRRHGSPKKSRETNLTATLRFIYLRLRPCVCVLDVLPIETAHVCYTVLPIINASSFDTNCMANTLHGRGQQKDL